MPLQESAKRKGELRVQARRILAAERSRPAAIAVRTLCELPELGRARTVALYAAIGDEVPVDAAAGAILQRGGRTLYPVRTDAGLELALVGGEHRLWPGPSGIGEPGLDAPRVDVDEVDVFVVPGLLFDRAGRRLGRGGGQYDRLLARARADAASIGICYADRVVDELPQDPWDIAMSLVVTDRFVLRSADGWRS